MRMFLVKTWISQSCEERVTLGLEVMQHRKQLELDWAASENGARPSGLLQLPPLSCFPPREGVACGTHLYDWFCDTGVSSLLPLHADLPISTISHPTEYKIPLPLVGSQPHLVALVGNLKCAILLVLYAILQTPKI